MTYLDLIKQVQNGSQMEYVLRKIGSGCLQTTYARKGDKENEQKTWRQHCQNTNCGECRVKFWESESIYNSLEEMGDSTGFMRNYFDD